MAVNKGLMSVAKLVAIDFLRCPLASYLVLPAAIWDALHQRIPPGCRVLGRSYDLYRRCEVVVVANR